ncbi:MAG: response regulator [Verrucomicrobiia bacterium]|jgi:CheY-like chemotaxis protein
MAKILLADDETYSLRLLQMTLKKTGCEIVSSVNGQAAYDQAVAELPSLIVMDVMMPVLDGLGALAKLKENEATREIPVIMLTAKGQTLTRTEAEESGAALFLTKPFSPTELLEEVKKFLPSA